MFTTTTTIANVSFTGLASHTETEPSPEEISRRVREIRNSWDRQEKMVRRRIARDRFERLIVAIEGSDCAA